MRPSVTLVALGANEAGAVASRISAFSDGLERRGWSVDLVDLARPAPSQLDSLLDRLPSRMRGAFEALGLEGDVMPRAGWNARQRLRDIDTELAVISVPPFSLLTSASLWLPPSVRLVIDYRDPWSIRRSPPLLARLTRPAERQAVRRAAAIVFAGAQEFGNDLVRRLRFPPAAVTSVPNGLHRADLEGVPPYTTNESANGTPLDLVFVGYWYGRNGPGALPQAMREAGECVATLTVIGQVSPSLQQQFVGVKIEQEGPLSRGDVYRRLARADAAVVCLDGSSAVESRVPAKIYDYLAVGTPVVALCPAGAALLHVPGAERFHHFEQGAVAELVAFLSSARDDRSVLRAGPQGSCTSRDDGVDALHHVLHRAARSSPYASARRAHRMAVDRIRHRHPRHRLAARPLPGCCAPSWLGPRPLPDRPAALPEAKWLTHDWLAAWTPTYVHGAGQP